MQYNWYIVLIVLYKKLSSILRSNLTKYWNVFVITFVRNILLINYFSLFFNIKCRQYWLTVSCFVKVLTKVNMRVLYVPIPICLLFYFYSAINYKFQLHFFLILYVCFSNSCGKHVYMVMKKQRTCSVGLMMKSLQNGISI